jgi:hypothetical protein
MCGCIENWAHWALILDLFTWKRPLLVTILGGWILWGFDPISNAIIKTPQAQQFTYRAQHNP